jgi:class 3 adenylate cyclase
VHTSDAVVRADPHLLGHHIAIAAAVATAARGGEILVTGIVRELVERQGSSVFGPPRRLPSQSPIDVLLAHPVRWTDVPAQQ